MTPADIDIINILSGGLKHELPEVYCLKNVIENDDSHYQDSVFDHTLRVSQILLWIMENTRNDLRKYFMSEIDFSNRMDLLIKAALLHDIGKEKCLCRNEGKTICPGHEEYGAVLVMPILNRFQFSEEEAAYISEIILRHGETYDLFSEEGNIINEKMEDYKLKYKNCYKDLIFIFLADILGSQLRYLQVNRFELMANSVYSLIKSWEIP